jgi:protein MBA1
MGNWVWRRFKKKKSDSEPHRQLLEDITAALQTSPVKMASTVGLTSSLSRSVICSRPRFPQFVPSSNNALAFAACQCRPFSQSLAPRAKGISQTVSMKNQAQPTQRSRTRELSRGSLPQDLGMLPGTFIRPLWQDMPSIFQQPRERLHMEWLWIKGWFQNMAACVFVSIAGGDRFECAC